MATWKQNSLTFHWPWKIFVFPWLFTDRGNPEKFKYCNDSVMVDKNGFFTGMQKLSCREKKCSLLKTWKSYEGRMRKKRSIFLQKRCYASSFILNQCQHFWVRANQYNNKSHRREMHSVYWWRPTWWPSQVDLQWELSKHRHLDEIIAEVGSIKITVADFKTIHYPISAEEKQIMKNYHKTWKFNHGWLNDKVTRI